MAGTTRLELATSAVEVKFVEKNANAPRKGNPAAHLGNAFGSERVNLERGMEIRETFGLYWSRPIWSNGSAVTRLRNAFACAWKVTVAEFRQVPAQDEVCLEGVFHYLGPAIESYDYALAQLLHALDEGGPRTLKAMNLIMGQEGIDREFAYVRPGDAEQIQRGRIRG